MTGAQDLRGHAVIVTGASALSVRPTSPAPARSPAWPARPSHRIGKTIEADTRTSDPNVSMKAGGV
jgi:hypothetical protein